MLFCCILAKSVAVGWLMTTSFSFPYKWFGPFVWMFTRSFSVPTLLSELDIFGELLSQENFSSSLVLQLLLLLFLRSDKNMAWYFLTSVSSAPLSYFYLTFSILCSYCPVLFHLDTISSTLSPGYFSGKELWFVHFASSESSDCSCSVSHYCIAVPCPDPGIGSCRSPSVSATFLRVTCYILVNFGNLRVFSPFEGHLIT